MEIMLDDLEVTTVFIRNTFGAYMCACHKTEKYWHKDTGWKAIDDAYGENLIVNISQGKNPNGYAGAWLVTPRFIWK